MSKAITVSDDFAKLADSIQKRKEFGDRTEAVDFIGQVFTSRYNATTKYAKKITAKPRKSRPKKAAKKAAKPRAKKAAPKSDPVTPAAAPASAAQA